MVSSDDEAPESIDNRAIKEKILGDKRSADKAVAQAKQEAKLKRRNLDERLKKQKEEKRQKTAAVALPAPLPQELLDTVAQEEMESAQRKSNIKPIIADERNSISIKTAKREAIVGPVKVMTLDAIESGGQAAVVNAVEFRNKHFYGTRVKRVPGKSYLHICDIFDNNA